MSEIPEPGIVSRISKWFVDFEATCNEMVYSATYNLWDKILICRNESTGAHDIFGGIPNSDTAGNMFAGFINNN